MLKERVLNYHLRTRNLNRRWHRTASWSFGLLQYTTEEEWHLDEVVGESGRCKWQLDLNEELATSSSYGSSKFALPLTISNLNTSLKNESTSNFGPETRVQA